MQNNIQLSEVLPAICLWRKTGFDFRATKDIDMVLIIEALTAEFGTAFWNYITEAGYEHKNKSTGETQFYRFSHLDNMLV